MLLAGKGNSFPSPVGRNYQDFCTKTEDNYDTLNAEFS